MAMKKRTSTPSRQTASSRKVNTQKKVNKVDTLRNTIKGSIDITQKIQSSHSLVEGLAVSVARDADLDIIPLINMSPIPNTELKDLLGGIL